MLSRRLLSLPKTIPFLSAATSFSAVSAPCYSLRFVTSQQGNVDVKGASANNSNSNNNNNKNKSISQQSDIAEYEEILKSALSNQSSPSDDDAKASAKLLRVAMPELFDELKVIQSQKQQASSSSPTQQHAKNNAKGKPDNNINNNNTRDDEVAALARKYLYIDSPEVFSWSCSKCSHEFEAPVIERALNLSGCPSCAATSQAPVLGLRPELLAEVAPSNNDPFLAAETIPLESRRKLRWKCRTCGCDWEARVCDRHHSNADRTAGGGGGGATHTRTIQGANCPRCQLRQSELVADKLRSEWHPIKNGDLDPATTLVLTERKKAVWWLCSVCTHEWFAKISSRFLGQGCPECKDRSRKSASSSSSMPGSGGGNARASSYAEDQIDASFASPTSRVTAYTVGKLRMTILKQKELADREYKYKTHLRHLEEHGKLKKLLSSSSSPSSSAAASTNSVNSNNNNTINGNGNGVVAAREVVVNKARPNEKREANVMLMEAKERVEKMKAAKDKAKKITVDEEDDEVEEPEHKVSVAKKPSDSKNKLNIKKKFEAAAAKLKSMKTGSIGKTSTKKQK